MKEDKKLARGVSWAVSLGSPTLGSTWKALGVIPAQGREILDGRANSSAAAADDRGFLLPQAAARPLLPGCCGRPRRAKPPSLSHAHHCKLLCRLPPSPTPISHGPTARCSFLSWCLWGASGGQGQSGVADAGWPWPWFQPPSQPFCALPIRDQLLGQC